MASLPDVTGRRMQHHLVVARGTLRLRPGTLELLGIGQPEGAVTGAALAAVQAAKSAHLALPLAPAVVLEHAEWAFDAATGSATMTVQYHGRAVPEAAALAGAAAGLMALGQAVDHLERGPDGQPAWAVDDLHIVQRTTR
ncbi:MAG: cyclic pyranopterin monophosphate synthase MoaC [Thermoplasmatota archaeon]